MPEDIRTCAANAPSYHTANSNSTPTVDTLCFEPLALPANLSREAGLIYIEQFHSLDECQTPNRPWMLASHEASHSALFFKPTCKKWDCPYCAEVNARRWVVRAREGVKTLIDAGHKVNFVTLTPHEKLTPEQSYWVLPHAWKKLHMRYKREIPAGDPGAYYAVPERHQSLKVHSHLLITGGLTKKWWKDNARECGLGYQSDVQEVKTLGVAGYVSKYLTKTLSDWPKGKRRVNTSRSWPALPDLPQKEGWKFTTYRTDEELTPVLRDLSGGRWFRVYGVTTANAWALLDYLSPQDQEV